MFSDLWCGGILLPWKMLVYYGQNKNSLNNCELVGHHEKMLKVGVLGGNCLCWYLVQFRCQFSQPLVNDCWDDIGWKCSNIIGGTTIWHWRPSQTIVPRDWVGCCEWLNEKVRKDLSWFVEGLGRSTRFCNPVQLFLLGWLELGKAQPQLVIAITSLGLLYWI